MPKMHLKLNAPENGYLVFLFCDFAARNEKFRLFKSKWQKFKILIYFKEESVPPPPLAGRLQPNSPDALWAESACCATQSKKICFWNEQFYCTFWEEKCPFHIPIWCIDAPKTPLVSMQPGFKLSSIVRRRQGCRTRYFHHKDYKWLWIPNWCFEIFTLFYLESLVHWKVKASNDLLMRHVILCTHFNGYSFWSSLTNKIKT